MRGLRRRASSTGALSPALLVLGRRVATQRSVGRMAGHRIGLSRAVVSGVGWGRRSRRTAGQAFDVLRAASQRLNRKLRDVADQLATSGEIATDPPGRDR